jgi:N-acetyl-gamma-glutamyl-phosphate reductase
VRIEDVDFTAIDLAFCALPHATSQAVIKRSAARPAHRRPVGRFPPARPGAYEKWYGKPHAAPEMQAEAVYGLTEFYRDEIRAARLVAGTGCNAATGQYALRPLIESRGDRSGRHHPRSEMRRLGRGAGAQGKPAPCRTVRGHAALCRGRHAPPSGRIRPGIQRWSPAAEVRIQFTPHLLPMNRGILATAWLDGDARQFTRF